MEPGITLQKAIILLIIRIFHMQSVFKGTNLEKGNYELNN